MFSCIMFADKMVAALVKEKKDAIALRTQVGALQDMLIDARNAADALDINSRTAVAHAEAQVRAEMYKSASEAFKEGMAYAKEMFRDLRAMA
jgi:uncharacterized coiled-coil DUF342 family protein